MTPQEKEQLVQRCLAINAKAGLFPDGVKVARELLEREGVDPEVIALIEPILQHRAQLRRACYDFAMKAFPVQPMDPGAQAIYDKTPEESE